MWSAGIERSKTARKLFCAALRVVYGVNEWVAVHNNDRLEKCRIEAGKHFLLLCGGSGLGGGQIRKQLAAVGSVPNGVCGVLEKDLAHDRAGNDEAKPSHWEKIKMSKTANAGRTTKTQKKKKSDGKKRRPDEPLRDNTGL